MKILKWIAIIIVALIAIPLILALFVPKNYTVKRTVTINRPVTEVFDYVKHIKNQDEYSVWNQKDPAMKKDYSGTDGTVGFTYHWDGNDEVGEGIQEITDIQQNEKIAMALHFKRPWESEAAAWMATQPEANGTAVTWGMKGESPYPWNAMNLFMGSMVGNDLQQGLENMKTNLEK